MAKKKKGELKLIMPKHVAPLAYFQMPLQVYHNHPSGIGFDIFKPELYAELHQAGVETHMSEDGSHYTKCAQVPRYFGFVRYVGSETKGEAAITESGEEMLAALSSDPVNYAKIHDLFAEAILGLQFGCRTDGVGSESYYEPFAIFFRAARDLDGIAANEFGYLIQSLDSELIGYKTAVSKIVAYRQAGMPVPVAAESQAKNISDWTAIKLLENLQFLVKTPDDRLKLNDSVKAKYGEAFEGLPLCSRGYLLQFFSIWLKKFRQIDDQTASNYVRSLQAMCADSAGPGRKSSGIFEGFYQVLTGCKPAKSVFEVTGLADYDRCYYELNKFWAMPQTKNAGDFNRLAYAECYFYAKAPQNIDNARLKNACEHYRNFLMWWDANKVDFEIGDLEVNMFNGNLGPIQKIVYGAPGTGKSHGTNGKLEDKDKNPLAVSFRTTFHPDSDYSTFVGAYKPTMNDATIGYEFSAQSFMKAYVKAWRILAGKETTNLPVVLIIEEINRGNCAQIFGDLFQLLDRDDTSGFSKYPITADVDLSKWLGDNARFGSNILAGVARPECIRQADWDLIVKGEMLALPPNLYIWATMNTSDQSLFPIDSAFKRRWDWEYVPIAKPDKDGDATWKERKIVANGNVYDWWDFITIVNEHILDVTKSEDKQMGYFFVKAPDSTGLIAADRFANKVLFYLFQDVFKDWELPEKIFGKTGSKEKYAFKDFFYAERTTVGNKVFKAGDVKEEVVAEFIEHLKNKAGKIVAKATA